MATTSKFKLHVVLDDDNEYDVVADQRDVAKWEAQEFGTSGAFIGDKLVTALRFFAWNALIRQGTLDKKMTWTKFEDSCVEVVQVPLDDADPKSGKRTTPDAS